MLYSCTACSLRLGCMLRHTIPHMGALWMCHAVMLDFMCGATERTTNADAGVGIGMFRGGFENLTKKGHELADKAFN